MAIKIGFGYDIHKLVPGRKLILGGVQIPYVKGLLGHSDADVLLHAICDALLGAAGLGDIGEHFPDTEPKYKDADSKKLLQEVKLLLEKGGFQVNNIDTVIVMEEPKLTPFKKLIQESIAGILNLPLDCVGVKAKTNEGLGEIGSKQAIAVYAVAAVGRK